MILMVPRHAADEENVRRLNHHRFQLQSLFRCANNDTSKAAKKQMTPAVCLRYLLRPVCCDHLFGADGSQNRNCGSHHIHRMSGSEFLSVHFQSLRKTSQRFQFCFVIFQLTGCRQAAVNQQISNFFKFCFFSQIPIYRIRGSEDHFRFGQRLPVQYFLLPRPKVQHSFWAQIVFLLS